jgi:hypothetical protein
MDTCIVRIYRSEKRGPRAFVGVVEKPAVDEKRAFHTIEELACILMGRSPGHTSRERRKVERLKLKLPVTVKGTSTGGKRFTEETTLENLSPWGAYLFLKNQVERYSELRLLIDSGRSDLDMKSRVVRFDKGHGKRGIGVFFERRW